MVPDSHYISLTTNGARGNQRFSCYEKIRLKTLPYDLDPFVSMEAHQNFINKTGQYDSISRVILKRRIKVDPSLEWMTILTQQKRERERDGKSVIVY